MKKYLSFKGRAKRLEFLITWCIIFFICLSLIIIIPPEILNLLFIKIIWYLLLIASSFILFATCTRRLHDLNYSGWFNVLWIIPIGNFILFGVLLFKKSEDEDNKYNFITNQK